MSGKSRMHEAILEAAADLHSAGLMDAKGYQKITSRHLDKKALPTVAPITSDEIREVRETAHLSQAAFAKYLNVSKGYVSDLERGAKQPKGPALALLNVIRRVGFDSIL